MTALRNLALILLTFAPCLLMPQRSLPGIPEYKSVLYQYPYLKWGTFFTSNTWLVFTEANAVAADGQGNGYYAGETEPFTGVPTPGCFQFIHGGGDEDGFIEKFDNNGERIWGTYYGGSQSDYIYDLTVDHEGCLIVAGLTGSTNGIATAGTYQPSIISPGDGFIAKFSPDGERIWGTYLGGIGNEWIGGVCVDLENNIIACGNTRSTAQFATPGSHQETYGGSPYGDGFLAKLTPDGLIVFCTYYGGADYDESYNVRCDSLNFIYMTGTTNSDTAIGTPGTQQPWYTPPYGDGFLVKFTPEGERVWGTYIGGVGSDYASDVCFDQSKNIYMAGGGQSYINVATPGAHKEEREGDEGYLIKYSPSGLRIWGTYFGGAEDEGFQSIRYNPAYGQIVLCGISNSDEGVAMPGAHQPDWYYGYSQQGDPRFDGFIAAFDTAGVQQWGTYMGGNMTDYVHDLDIDSLNNIIYCGYSSSQSSPYLTTPGCFQPTHTNQHAAFFGMFAIDTLTSVNSLTDQFSAFEVSPNPFIDEVVITLPQERQCKGVFHVFDLEGRKLRDGDLENGKNRQCLSNLSPGIFILQVIQGDHVSLQKIIKK